MDPSARYGQPRLYYGSGTIYRGPVVEPAPVAPDLEPIARGITLRFYDSAGIKTAEISSGTSQSALISATWELLPTGCGGASFTLSDQLPQFLTISHNQRIDVHLWGYTQPIWSGFVRRLASPITSTWPRTYEAYGYQAHLDRVIIREQDYAEQITADVVSELVRDYLDPDTGILYSRAKICQTCRYRVRDLQFRYITARRAMEQLVNLAGLYEFGVDAEREFFFRRQLRSVTEHIWVGVHTDQADVDEDSERLANRLWVQSGQRSGSGDNYLPVPLEDKGSQATYGVWEDTVRAPSVFNETDAYRFASVELSRRARPAVVTRISGLRYEGTPIDCRGQVRVVGRDGTEVTTGKQRVRYTVTGSRIEVDLDLGERELDIPGWFSELSAQQARLELIQQATNRQV